MPPHHRHSHNLEPMKKLDISNKNGLKIYPDTKEIVNKINELIEGLNCIISLIR